MCSHRSQLFASSQYIHVLAPDDPCKSIHTRMLLTLLSKFIQVVLDVWYALKCTVRRSTSTSRTLLRSVRCFAIAWDTHLSSRRHWVCGEDGHEEFAKTLLGLKCVNCSIRLDTRESVLGRFKRDGYLMIISNFQSFTHF